MNMRVPRVFALALLVCAGCSSLEHKAPGNVLIPNQTLNISKSVIVPAESMAAAALLYVIVDPLAPNWQVEEVRLDASRYRIALKKKRFTTGGDGEAAQVFSRRAAQLARDLGSGSYRVIEFTEGVESTVPIAQRVAQGIVEIIP